MESNELIVCQNVSLGYEGQSVLTDLNLTIKAGDYLCIVGDNGSGKSTLLRGILGLLTPQSGKILRANELEKLTKQDIIDISQKIDTFETSILPYEDCCTIFVAKHPATKPKLMDIQISEKKLVDIEEQIQRAVEGCEIVEVGE